VPNQASGIDWAREAAPFREKVLAAMESRGGMCGLRSHVVEEQAITPLTWESERDVFLGATFNLAHTLTQMLYFRPHNAFEEIDRCFLVGGGTHPGSGLPTIFESGRLSANLVCARFGVPYPPPKPPPESRL
jgi:phytoene desaturase